MKTYAVVVCYFRAGPKIRETLRRVLAQSIPPAEVIVVDNDSDDGVLDKVLLHPDFSSVRLLSLEKNEGYAGGMNRGAAAVRSPTDCILFLTHEVALDPTACARLLEAMRPGVALVGPLLRRDGTGEIWSAGGTLDKRGRTGHQATPRRETEPYDVDWLDGAALLFDRPRFTAIGGFDERYFLYWEDVDVCVRIRRLGAVLCAPSALATQETGMTPPYWAARNRVIFWRRHGGRRRAAVAAASELRGAIRSVARRKNRRYRDAAGRLLGVVDGVTGHLAPRRGRLRSLG